MIQPDSVENALQGLANEIHNNDGGGAERLRRLAAAVKTGQYAQTWLDADIYKIIDPDGIVERFRIRQVRSGLIDVLEVIRNTLIFAPIIVTWYGISQATATYHELLSELLKTHPDQVAQPFLYLWEQGFGGRLSPLLTLSSIGLIDAGILVIIFILTFVTFTLSAASTNRNEQKVQELRTRLFHALAGASLYLHSDQQQQQQQQRQQYPPLTAGDNLEAVAKDIALMAQAATTTLKQMSQQLLQQFTNTTTQITTRLDGVTTQLSNRFNSMSQQMEQQLQEGQRYLATLNGFAGGLDQLAHEMKGAAQTLKDMNGELVAGVKELIEPAKELSVQQKKLMDAAQDSVVHLEGVAVKLTELGKNQDRWGKDLSNILDTLEDALDKAVQLATNIGNMTTKQNEFLQYLEKQHDAQRHLATLTSEATVNIRDALAEMKTGATSLRSIAHDLSDIVDLQRSTNISAFTQGYGNAAQMLENSGRSLNASAIQIYQASQKLRDITDELEQRLATIK